MNSNEKPLSDQELENLARKLRPYLDAGADNLKPGIAYRLQTARRAALASLETADSTAAAVNADGSLASWSGWQQRFTDWRFWAIGRIAASTLALFGYEEWRAATTARETADVDLLLLADELPVDAFLDSGFRAYLTSQQQ